MRIAYFHMRIFQKNLSKQRCGEKEEDTRFSDFSTRYSLIRKFIAKNGFSGIVTQGCTAGQYIMVNIFFAVNLLPDQRYVNPLNSLTKRFCKIYDNTLKISVIYH